MTASFSTRDAHINGVWTVSGGIMIFVPELGYPSSFFIGLVCADCIYGVSKLAERLKDVGGRFLDQDTRQPVSHVGRRCGPQSEDHLMHLHRLGPY
jgi:hypothetical protein